MTMQDSAARTLAHRSPALPGFWISHGLLPLLAFSLLQQAILRFSLDLRLADFWFQLEGSRWALRDNWLASDVIHSGGRELSQVLLVLVLVLMGGSWISRRLAAWRRGLIYLFLATLSGVALVSIAKHFSAQDCPWSLVRYGGDRLYHPLFGATPGDSGGGCFPAGHASAGYAWLALYFLVLHYRPALRHLALLPGLGLGLLFGVAQQLRGAHFLSHDLWTLTICWFSALLLYRWLLMPHNR